MTDDAQLRRRTFAATVGLAGATALAGCSGGSGGDGGDDGDGGDGGKRSFGGWLDNVDNYDGVVDETGSGKVTVQVGAAGNGGHFAFEPAAVKVSSGTTVTWEWTDEGTYNVAANDGSFESEMTSEAGYTFEHTFDDAGTYKYSCTPHESMGMKGVVVVE
jgi:halocyanin-like protein